MSTLPDLVRGCTCDDLLFTSQYSVLERRDPSAIDLSCSLSQHLTLKRPVVSANMDTVTRTEMAIAVAEEGGIGIVDRGFRSGDIEPQIREVEKVKRGSTASSWTATRSRRRRRSARLWHRLLGGPAAENGSLRQGDGARGRVDRGPQGILVLGLCPLLCPRLALG